jgi:hypothetical protein
MVHTSLTRISDLADESFGVERLPFERWTDGDYVVARVAAPPRGFTTVELASGRMAEVVEDDVLIGALGVRHATLEAVGSWRAVGADGRLDVLTSAGLLGRVTSLSQALPQIIETRYHGHVVRDGAKVTMGEFAPAAGDLSYRVPTILIAGTSMSAGKTASAKVVIRALKGAGSVRVVGTKLTGAGRYRDILSMRDAGADEIFDFVDVGLPSSIGPKSAFEPSVRRLLSYIAATDPDVVVAEVGASPLEPYNGEAALEALGGNVRVVLMCASDPYAVVGVIQGFRLQPDLIAGLATSTSAGVELVEKLTGIRALNLLDPESRPELERVLQEKLRLR